MTQKMEVLNTLKRWRDGGITGGATAHVLATWTGVPGPSVRRILGELGAKGLVVRGDNKQWMLAPVPVPANEVQL